MTIFSDEDKEVIERDYFNRMKEKVTIYFFRSKNEKINQVLSELLNELRDITEKIDVIERDFSDSGELERSFNVSLTPCTVISGLDRYLKFHGVPAGQEFPVFLEAIAMISGDEVSIDKDVEEVIKSINKSVDLKIFVTLSCPYCPLMVETAYKFATKSDKIKVEVYEASEFLDLVKKYEIKAVPKIVINDEISFEGAVPPMIFASYIKSAFK